MKRNIAVAVIILLLVAAVGYYFRHQILNQYGVLEVKTNQELTVVINGEQVGRTPVRKKLPPQQATIQLLSAENGQESVWEGQAVVNHGTISLVRRNFTKDRQSSWGETLTFSSIPAKKEGAFSVTSYPTEAVVIFDGESKGYTPLLLEGLAPGQHNLELIKDGYENVVLGVNISPGYQLNAAVKLAVLTEQESPAKTPSPTPAQPQVVIGETPTGWLRVRSGAGTGFEEVARVQPGEKYPQLDENNGWLKIQLEEESGWVSGQYVTIEAEKD